jgi:hypothetical protein
LKKIFTADFIKKKIPLMSADVIEKMYSADFIAKHLKTMSSADFIEN